MIGDRVGQASGLKMCYAALTKGLIALGTELLMAAHLMGLDQALRDEQRESIPAVLGWLEGAIPGMPPKSYRWVGEMEEIAATFEEAGLPGGFHAAAADVYRRLARFKDATETPPLEDVLAALQDESADGL